MSSTRFSIASALDQAHHLLSRHHIPHSEIEAETLLSHILKKDRSYLIAHQNGCISKTQKNRFFGFVHRRMKHEPLAYLLVRQPFLRHSFCVSPDVLIPRPETEFLVIHTLDIISRMRKKKLRILDIGIGSGCILISILKETQNATGVGADISKKALAVARKNIRREGLKKSIRLVSSDLFANVSGIFDIIVSNPPYLSPQEIKTSPTARDLTFEPRQALISPEKGFQTTRKILQAAPRFLEKNGFLILEINPSHARKISQFLKKNWPHASLEIKKDLNGHKRMAIIRMSPLSS
ncbi:MAG: peptide chain release factor N(5)-glutamine methyltransferase [Parcubacteria group bacterium]|nr:peptide chain release factor N(5)-glutamine methyltransferase [Parcubacteria group bacterium]